MLAHAFEGGDGFWLNVAETVTSLATVRSQAAVPLHAPPHATKRQPADTPGGGANVWEDAAQRNHCRFVSGSTFDGTGSGSALAATGRGVYDCPLVGTVRVSVSFQVSATQG